MKIPEPLPQILKKNGYTYTLIRRDKNICIYQQGVAPDLFYYEVFKVKVKKGTIFKGKELPERESFPKDEDFGSSAWTKRTLKEALVKFNELLNKEKGTNC